MNGNVLFQFSAVGRKWLFTTFFAVGCDALPSETDDDTEMPYAWPAHSHLFYAFFVETTKDESLKCSFLPSKVENFNITYHVLWG